MNHFVSPSIPVSPEIGERSACQVETAARTPRVYLADLLSAPSALLAGAVKIALDIPESNIGLVACSAELLTDIKYAQLRLPERASFPAWMLAFDRLLAELKEHTKITEGGDRAAGVGLKPGRMALMLTLPSRSLSAKSAGTLRALRCALLLTHIDARRPLSSEAVIYFSRLLANRHEPEIQRVLLGLGTDPASLTSLRASFSPESSAARMTTLLLRTLDTPLGSPPSTPQSAARLVPSQKPQKEKPADDEEPKREKRTNLPTDLISALLSKVQFSRPKDNSGVNGITDYLQPCEFPSAFCWLISDLQGPDKKKALATMVSAFVRCRPKFFCLISLQRDDWQSVWLDLEAGHLCWIIESVISPKRYLAAARSRSMKLRHPCRIPLPIEIVSLLQILKVVSPQARTLAELFVEDPELLDRETKAYLRRKSTTSHHVTLSSLTNSYGRFLLSNCNDETIAAALSLDFTLGTPANLNYWPLRARRICEITTNAYRRLGFTGELYCSPIFDTGSLYVNSTNAVRKLLNGQLGQAINAFNSIHNRSSFSDLKRTHNRIAVAVLTLVVVVFAPGNQRIRHLKRSGERP